MTALTVLLILMNNKENRGGLDAKRRFSTMI